MPTFKYIARDANGAEQQGTLVADGQAGAVRTLDERGLYTVQIWEERAVGSGLSLGGRVRLSELAGFYSQLGDLLSAGVPILRALDVLSRQKSGRALPGVVRELREDVAGGAELADAMEKHTLAFPELHVGMVRAGEQGGFLESVLHRLAEFVEQRDQLRNKVIASLIYPVFLLAAGLVIVIVAVTYFLPKLEPMFDNMKNIPALTQAVMSFGHFLTNHYIAVFLGILLIVVGVLPYARSAAGRRVWHRVQFRLPGVGDIFRMVAICRFCRILGTLLSNGVEVLQALNTSRESAGNVLLAEVIADAAEAVRAGKSLSQTLRDSGLFPDDIVETIAVAEQTNRLSTVLIEIATRNEQRISRKVDTAVRMLEPVMLLVVFLMVGVLAMALMLPILKMSAGGLGG